MKKIITLIMAFLVCAAMAVPAFASTSDTRITGFSVNVYIPGCGVKKQSVCLRTGQVVQ